MADLPKVALAPESYSDLFAGWARHPEARPFAGGTSFMRAGGKREREPELPEAVISLGKIEEMRRIARSERYLDIGAAVRLSRIIELRKFVPGVLVRCLRDIAGPQLRNMATIGGNVCERLDSVAALAALDAQYELRNAQSSWWVTAARFSLDGGSGALGPQELMCRIRVPLDGWDYSAYKKFARREGGDRCAVFLARPQKDTLADIRVICKAGSRIWRDRDGEMLLVGKRLPLTRRVAAAFIQSWDSFLRVESADELLRGELVSFIEANARNLTE